MYMTGVVHCAPCPIQCIASLLLSIVFEAKQKSADFLQATVKMKLGLKRVVANRKPGCRIRRGACFGAERPWN